MAKSSEETPLMKQYNAIKVKHPGALLLFRVGDFYETFGADAEKASKILGITLTKRGSGSASETALAGFPYHSLDNYLPKLVKAGQRVAVCDQLEDPKSVKGIVKRGVTELVTPGVSFNDHVLEQKRNNYLAAVYFGKTNIGISFLDVSTGEFLVAQGSREYVDKLLQSFRPSEVLCAKPKKSEFFKCFTDDYNNFFQEDWVYSLEYATEVLTRHFKTANLKGFGVEGLADGVVASGGIMQYLYDTEHKEINHISSIARLEEDRYVWLDKFTIRNLELVYPQFEGGVPLIEILDQTYTPMGGRLLRKWMLLPLKELAPIQERLNVVEIFVKEKGFLEGLRHTLMPIGDLERLISKVAVRRVNPRELNQLRKSLSQVPHIKTLIQELGTASEGLQKLVGQLHDCEFIQKKIEQVLKPETPIVINQGNLINDGVDEELDKLRAIAFSGKDYLLQIQHREVQRTGISSLKISYNKVFGYYIEVTHTHKDKVPSDWIRKQTLANAERFITEELKEYEEKILSAEDKIQVIEQRIFEDLVSAVSDFIPQIQQNAQVIARIDCLSSFACVASKNNYVKPEVNESKAIDIKEGRHPVIERQLQSGDGYVPNDIYLDDATQQIMIITGPNMAGKSALLRQTALITLMAQVGSFVPATAASIGLVDKVFTRVGASDNLSKGESTFMVEMTETASILNNLSDRSLILMDEIGRGTSTYDGISIAWAIVEYLHQYKKGKAKTLFATHYHELNQLTEEFPRVKNFNVSVKEVGNKIVFMRKLKEGGSEHSFGIHVAQLAGMPNPIVLRANEIMHHLEKEKVKADPKKALKEMPKNNYQLSIFEANDPNYMKVKELLSSIDINTISP
ncbi:MAG TPA: DNA mismatch repair protein MutS, partial [Cytophagales bacterium]|nr:DNA mismatch repair protein MutS [Cytophagales bacterium]